MVYSIPIAEARKRLTTLPKSLEAGKDSDVIAVTRRGKPVLAILPWDIYDSISETLEVLSDEVMLKELKSSLKELSQGKSVSWEEAKKGIL